MATDADTDAIRSYYLHKIKQHQSDLLVEISMLEATIKELEFKMEAGGEYHDIYKELLHEAREQHMDLLDLIRINQEVEEAEYDEEAAEYERTVEENIRASEAYAACCDI